MRVSKERQRWVVASLVIAAALHLLVILPLVYLLLPDDEPSEILYRSPRIKPYQLVLEPEEEPQEEPRQIVSIDAPATEEEPDHARYEDRVHRRVDEETRARDRGQPVAVPVQPTRPQPQQPRQQRRAEEREATRQAPEETREAPERPSQEAPPVDNDELAAVFAPSQRGSEPSRRARVEDRNREDNRQQPPTENPLDLSAFSPTMETASEFVAVPGAPSADYLDLPQGDRDQVNSYENMYWSYWDRIKTQVRPHWRPSSVYRERDPTGRVFGVEDRYTVLRVTLNGDGSLRHIYLERSSDLDFLDREAIRAVRAAEPFANVPEGLKDERGLLSFRFGFYFEVSSSNFRIRREDW